MPSRRLFVGVVFLLLLGLPLLSGCDEETLTAPEIQNDLFNSYVSIGNSITAGFQSGGISSQTQSQSYAVLLAEQMNTPFGVPRLEAPGCPPPFVSFFNASGIPDPQRPQGTDDETCALRTAQPPLRVNNVAVPGAAAIDALSNQNEDSSPNPLTQFLLGGRTQIEAALDVNPTFATVWIGNNDVLDPALNGTANVTPVPEFQQRYTQLLDQLTASENFQGGALVGVANVVFTPFFSPGPVYLALDQAGQFPPNFDVDSNCGTQDPNTGLTPLVSLPYGFGLIGQALRNPNQIVRLDCEAPGPVLTLTEVSILAGTAQQYNAFIQQQAQNRGLAYFNPNQILGALYTNDDGDRDPTNDLIPKFPDRDSDQPFGQFFSLDGVHPSAATQRVVTAQLVATINETYNTNLTPPENVPSLPTGGQ